MALPFLLLRIGADSGAQVGFRGLLAFWAGGGAAAAEIPVDQPGVGGGMLWPRLPLEVVEGIGFGVLPQIEGEAHGVVSAAGAAAGKLRRFESAATGSIGVAGNSLAAFTIKAAGRGCCGQTGAAVAQFKIKMAASGSAGTCGKGFGMVRNLDGAAVGRHDDDEAKVVTFLLAA